MKRCVSGLLSTIVLGCFVIIQPANAQDRKKGGTVCVTSSVGQQFELKKVGIMVFGNENKAISIADWKIDDKVHAKVKGLLGSKFAIKRIEFSQETLKEAFDETLGIFRDLAEQRRKVLGDKVASANCTYLLTILPGASQFGSGNQYVQGLGVVDAESILGASRRLYALSHLAVFDAKTMERLDRSRGETDQDTLFAPIKGPYKDIEAGAEIPMEAFAADPETRKTVWAFLERSLELTVPGLFELETLQSKAKTLSAQKNRPVHSVSEDWPRN
jgi:hypothetical protein